MLLVLAVAVLAVILWCWIVQPTVVVTTVTVTSATTGNNDQSSRVVLDASGYVIARQKATVSSEIPGKLVEVLVEEGAFVEQGQVLARLDDSLTQAELQLARSQSKSTIHAIEEKRIELADAERTLQRMQQLIRNNSVSQEAVDLAKTDVDLKRVALREAELEVDIVRNNVNMIQARIDKAVIRAPFSGVVIAKNAQVGEVVSPASAGGGFTRTGIYTIVNMNSLKIEVDVNEEYIRRISPGQSATAILDAYPNWPIPVEVHAIVPTADRQKATVKVRLEFVEDDEPRLLPDMGVSVSFDAIGSSPDQPEYNGNINAVSMPAEAIFTDNNVKVAFVLEQGYVRRQVLDTSDITLADNGQALVRAGLKEGQQVVVSANGELEDGLQVRIR